MEIGFLEFISGKVLYIVPALYFIGWSLTRTPRIPCWSIPFILMGLGIAVSNLILGVSIEATVEGVLCAGAAVLGKELIKQGKEGAGSRKSKCGNTAKN
ncbi:phage holin family protein [Clostridia bacterium OttesenSCG-928-F22]|nr:phage holin family protein [Clostridia bacterium OttesenSCG-928-F22]